MALLKSIGLGALAAVCLPFCVPGEPKAEALALLQAHPKARASGNSCLARMLRLVDGQWTTGRDVLQVASGNVTPFQTHQVTGIFLDPKHKFAMCNIHKVGSSAWIHIESKLMSNDPYHRGLQHNDNSLQKQSWAAVGRDGATELFRDPKAIRAVFLRDPLARFASAFLNKCFSEHCHCSRCEARPKEKRGEPIDFGTAIHWGLREVSRVHDRHWTPQSSQCELKMHLRDFNLVGLYTHDTLGDDASCVMEVAGIENFNVAEDGSKDPFWRSSAQSGPQSKSLQNDEEAMLKKLFSKKSALALKDAYAEDYSFFNLPYPSWIDGATGEWENVVPASCHGDSFVQLQDDDNIVMAARRAGYF